MPLDHSRDRHVTLHSNMELGCGTLYQLMLYLALALTLLRTQLILLFQLVHFVVRVVCFFLFFWDSFILAATIGASFFCFNVSTVESTIRVQVGGEGINPWFNSTYLPQALQ